MARDLCMQQPPTAPAAATSPDDHELARRFFEHDDRAALEDLLARHADISYRLALRIAGNEPDAEEIVQRACVEVVQARSRFRGEAQFRTWLLGVVVNCGRMWLREEKRRKRREELAVQMREEPTEAVADAESEAALRRTAVNLVKALPEHYRLPVWMHYVEGLTFREIAGALNQPEGTVRSQASRGLDVLRERLGAAGLQASAAMLPGLLVASPLESAPATLLAALKGLTAPGAATAAGGSATAAGGKLAGAAAMKITLGLAAVTLVAGGAWLAVQPGGNSAEKPEGVPAEAPGAPEASPGSTGGMTGWRGDWTGRWPDATPPTVWARYVKTVADHRCQASKPKGDKPEKNDPLTHGLIREWLVAGPFDAPEASDKEKELDGSQLPETELQPDAGDKAGDTEWKPWTGTGLNMATLNNYGHVGVSFTRLYGQVERKAAYAHTYLFSPAGGSYRLNFSTWQSVRVWVNGALACPRVDTREHMPQHVAITLKPGWNRLLIKSVWGVGKADSEWSAWKFAVYLQSTDPGTAVEEKNLCWHVATPGSSIAAPAVVGDRLYVSADPYFVACYSATDGKCLWLRSMSYFDMLEPERRKEVPNFEAKAKGLTEQMGAACEAFVRGDSSKLEPAKKAVNDALKEIDPTRATRMNAWEQGQPGWTVTPCSDGKKIWVWCQTGAAACYDLDGKLLWSRQEEFPGNRHHGFSISPTLAGGKFIAMQNHITAYDAETGKTAWTAKGMTLTWGSLVPLRVNGKDAVFSTEGTLIDAADGKILWGTSKLGSSIVPTPVTDGADTLFAYSSGKGLAAYTLPEMTKKWDDTAEKVYLGAGWAGAFSGSPLYHDGLIYQASMTGVLICRDAKTGQLVYKQELDCAPRMGYVTTPGMSASLSMAGKYIYATDNTFVTVVFEPGRTFKQVAKNVIEMSGEGQIWSYPVFKGSRMYYRGPTFLYCIGEK